MKSALLKYKELLLGSRNVMAIGNSCFFDDTKKYAQLYPMKDTVKQANYQSNTQGYTRKRINRKMLRK